MSSFNVSLASGLEMGASTQEAVLKELDLDLLTPNVYSSQCGDAADEAFADGQSLLESMAMEDFLNDVVEQQNAGRIKVISNVLVRGAKKPAPSKLEKTLTMPPAITRSKRVFYDTINGCGDKQDDGGNRKGKFSFKKPAKLPKISSAPQVLEQQHKPIFPTVKITEGPGELSPPSQHIPCGQVSTPSQLPTLPSPPSNSQSYDLSPSFPPTPSPVNVTIDHPLSPVLGGNRKRLAEKRKKSAAADAISQSSQPDWGAATSSQKDVFSKAYAVKRQLVKEMNAECRELERQECELKVLKDKILELESGMDRKRLNIIKCRDTLGLVSKTFNFSE